jgi:SAM-dependent methyltransferase
MNSFIRRLAPSFGTENELNRRAWLQRVLRQIPASNRVLDAGAGELRNKTLCSHLNYVSQDFCQYEGGGNGSGLQTGTWDTSRIDIVSDITDIPEPDASFDAILCTEVFEHLPDPLSALNEFTRLLRRGGILIITAPFCSLTHFAPYHFYSGFNRYFYVSHLGERGFNIEQLVSNGDWFAYMAQETRRLPFMAKNFVGRESIASYLLGFVMIKLLHYLSKRDKGSNELLCFGYFCLARKK